MATPTGCVFSPWTLVKIGLVVGAWAVLSLSGGLATAATTTIDFESFDSGDLLTDDLREPEGVTFPLGVVVGTCTPQTCFTAHSGDKVIRTRLADEFRKKPLLMRFDAGQRRVRIFVHSDSDRVHAVDMFAFDATGRVVDTDSDVTEFTLREFPWRLLEVESPSGAAEIREVRVESRIRGSSDPEPSNFVVFDDLTFEGEPPPPPVVDREAPTLQIVEPFFGGTITLVTRRQLDVRLFASDNIGLDRVSAVVTEGFTSTGAPVIEPLDFCGTPDTGPCPNAGPAGDAELDRTRSISLPSALFPPGAYSVTAEACDDAGLCTPANSPFALDVLAAPVDVRVARVEVNQGIMPRLAEPPALGDFPRRPALGVRLVPGKDTVVRWYAFIDDPSVTDPSASADFTASMEVTVVRQDGTRETVSMAPNTGSSSATVGVDPGPLDLTRELLAMRGDRARTLNFVIPGDFLSDAQSLEIRLEGGPLGFHTGKVLYSLLPEPRLGVHIVRLIGGSTPTPTETQIRQVILRYLRHALPVSEVRVLSVRNFNILRPSQQRSCGLLRSQVQHTFAADTAAVDAFGLPSPPPPTFADDRSVELVVGVVPSNVLTRNYLGCAMLSGRRVGDAVITENFGDVAAQEVSHALTLEHVTDLHGELGAFVPWPYRHGTIGERNYGAIPTRTGFPTPEQPFGEWEVAIVDPCPADAPGETRVPCVIAFSTPVHPMSHDYMSYGASSNTLPIQTFSNSWVSDITYNRVRREILEPFLSASAGPASTGMSAGSHEPRRVEAFLVSGEFDEAGYLTLEPLLRKPMPPIALDRSRDGPMTLRFLDSEGKILAEHRFAKRELSVDPVAHRDVVDEVVPFVEGVERVVVTDRGRTVLDERASPNPPRVRVVSPNGGEVLASGIHKVAWEASDADGDDLTFLIQYSPDGGQRWQGVDLVEGDQRTAALNVGELARGRRAIVRVTASDDINTAVDISDCGFALGTKEVVTCVPVDVKPGSCPNPLNVRSRGVLPAAILGTEDFDVAAIDPSTVRLAGVAPLRWSLEHANTRPFTPFLNKDGPESCNGKGGDGFLDLTFKFDTQDLVVSLEKHLDRPLENGQVITLDLTGKLGDGSEIEGQDVILVCPRCK